MRIKSWYDKYKMLIPVLILSIFCISTILGHIFDTTDTLVYGEFSRYIITNKHYGAFIMVVINFIAFFYLIYLYKYILLLTLVLGFLNVINFTLSESQIVIRISGSEVRFQHFSLFVGILTIVIGYKRIIEIYKEEFGKSSKQILIDEQEKYVEDIHKLKNFYKNKTSDELTQILEDKRYTQAALEAIKQVLNER